MHALQRKWDGIYESRDVEHDSHPAILDEAEHLLPARGRAFDLACGAGGGSVFLARRGLEVRAWDLSGVAVRKLQDFAAREGLSISAHAVDVTATPLPESAFDVVLVSRFLERGLCADLARSLRPGGVLLYQTFGIEAAAGEKRMNPAYCLQRGELLRLFAGLQPLMYREEGLAGDCTRGLRGEVRLVAQRAILP
jgi:SAM-dependent methyltransferase